MVFLFDSEESFSFIILSGRSSTEGAGVSNLKTKRKKIALSKSIVLQWNVNLKSEFREGSSAINFLF